MSKLHRWARSVRFGIFLLTVIGAASIYGTLLPYQDSLDRVFHAWWYQGLLLLLAVNVGLASWHTLRVTLPAENKPSFFTKPKTFEALPRHETLVRDELTREAAARSLDAAQAAATAAGYRVFRQDLSLCAMKGLQSRVGALVSHAGIIVIVIGAAA